MKQIVSLIIALPCVMSAAAQSEMSDSISAKELTEIVIEAPKVIRKSDMDVYHPSKSAVENSKTGMQLLSNLMIPSLSVNDALSTISAAGESVEVRINGRKSTIEQVRALLPETIKRVEWIDNPGLRYGGANYVLNFIVANPTLGGSLQLYAMPALNAAWGNYNASAKINVGRSQFEVGSFLKVTNRIKSYREYSETFTYPDGHSITRDETPLSGSMNYTFGRLFATYNYIRPDTTVFVAYLSASRDFNNREMFEGRMSLSDGSDDILLTDASGSKGTYPSLSLYLQQNFVRKQTLVVDFSTSFYLGHSFSEYVEKLPATGSFLNDINTMITDRNQAYALEADYIKNWKNSRLTAGVSYSAKRNRSEYETLGGEIFHQRQDRLYFFAEYFRRFGKWTVTAGMGAQYTDFLFKESHRGNHSWSTRPQATVTYFLNQNHNFRLNFTTWQSTPSLSETNVVPQQLDGFQWRVGNPDLKTANSYRLTFRYGFNLPRFSGSFGVRAYTSPNAITPVLGWEGERLITSYENSRGLKNLTFFLSPQVEIIPEWFSLSGYLQYRMERMKGTGYDLTHNGWSGNAELQVSHWGFTFTAQYEYAQRSLWGETLSWGEDISIITLNYNWKSWQFGAGMIMPFGKYDRGSKSMCKWNMNEKHKRVKLRIPFISAAWNIQWGRQKRNVRKLIDSNANTDRSTAGGR